MGRLLEEVQLWNTPIVGAYLLWKFTQGYCDNHPNGDAPVGLLHFVAMPVLTSSKLMKPISDKRPDLQSYVRSFEDTKDSDILLSIQERAMDKREYTMASIDIAVSEGLLAWDVVSGKLYPCKLQNEPSRGNALKTVFSKDGRQAEILGKWFSKHDIPSIAAYLKVVF